MELAESGFWGHGKSSFFFTNKNYIYQPNPLPMTSIRLLFTVSAFLFSSYVNVGESITAKDLEGNWKMTDVKVTNQSPESHVTLDNCYLCDVYKAKIGLVFTADGKVNYSNYGNPNPVQYTVQGNILSLYTEEGEAAQPTSGTANQNSSAKTSVDFVVSLHDNVLTLTRIYPAFTETYTLTK
jgi:hypothetical protein